MERFKQFLLKLQNYTLLSFETIKAVSKIKKYKRDVIQEIYNIGTTAVKLVFFGGLFVGIILAIETGNQLDEFGAKTLVGRTVTLGLIRELGPVITGLLLAARTGAKNASEIGGMQLSEQIDAIRAFGTDPIHKLVFPRTLAAVIIFLPLTLIADLTGILGGMVISDLFLHVDSSFFWNTAIYDLEMNDIVTGFSKPVIFAFFISTISCYYGFTTKGGTSGLGKATINAVVVSTGAVLILDFIFTKIIWAFV